jgi:glycosyltransferase involved in cell wall biosynthesis
MRIALVVDAFAPARTSAAVQIRDLALELQAQGHSPTVIVPSPEIEHAWQFERIDGIDVVRLRAFRTKDIGHLRRGLAEVMLSAAMLASLVRSPLRSVRWDGVAWYSPSICLGPFASALKTRSGCRGYLILRDLFPDWALETGVMREGAVYRFFKLIERYQYGVADVIGVQATGNLAYFDGWSRIRGRRVEVLNNWLACAPAGTSPVDVSSSELAGKQVFVYAGNMGVAQDMDCLIALVEQMRARADVGFLFVGRGSEVPRLREAATQWPHVVVRDEVEPRELPSVLAQCHVGLVSLDRRHRTHNIPGKFLTYLRAGLPVLARINPGNDLERIMRDSDVGLVTASADAAELNRLAVELIDHPARREAMGVRGRALAEAMFSPATAARQVVAGLQA